MPPGLPPRLLAETRGYQVTWHETLDSTNSEAMRQAIAGAPSRLWIVAGQQTAGRGRLGRPWVSDGSNLYASLLLVGEIEPAQAAQLGFVTGVALVQALAPFMPQGPLPQLKWPNDVLCDGRKIAGILLEASLLPDGRFACVIGCGVNCASYPQSTPYPASSLAELGVTIAPVDLLSAFCDRFAEWFDTWHEKASSEAVSGEPCGFAAVRAAWLEYAAHRGKPISIVQQDRTIQGVFETLDENGWLVIRTANGQEKINTGDIMLPSTAQYMQMET